MSPFYFRLMDKIIVKGEEINFASIMKRMNFVQDMKGYTRKFTFTTVIDGEFHIGHIYAGCSGRLTKIEYEHIKEWVEWFDRI